MKKTRFLLLMLLAAGLLGFMPFLPSQGELQLDLLVKDNQGRPFRDTDVEFIEIHSRERVVLTTNEEGRVSHYFKSGRFWQINIKDIRNYFFWQFEVVPQKRIRQQRTITYSYEKYLRETRPPVDRTKLNITTENQRFSVDEKATKELAVVKVTFKKADKSPLRDYPVQLTCYKLEKSYSAKTNPAGTATFKVPKGQDYEIDIDGIESFNYVDLPDREYWTATRTITYEPTDIEEKVVNDTITQKLPEGQEGTSGRVYTRITFKQKDGPWADEPVFIDEFNSNNVYVARTNQLGEAEFLLPKGKRFMIHGRYERDLDVLDFRRRRGVGYSHKTLTYKPLEKLQYPERYIPTPEALIVKAFQDFIEKQFPGPVAGEPILKNNSKWGNKINAKSKEAVLKLAFTAGERTGLENTPPLNLSFVLDKSGSMAGHERMDQLKESMYAFIEQLRPSDMVSLVTFEDFETVVIPAQKIGANKERLNHSIYMIEANGGTNIFKGLMEGYKQVNQMMRPNYTNRVILLTDGYGVTPPADILKGQKPYTDKGIQCSAVGVGEYYNVALLQLLASGGLIEHVGESSDMKKVFLEELASVLYPVAEDVTVTVEFPARLKYKQLYGYPLKEKSNNRLKLKLKNFYSGLSQLALLRFELENPDPSLEKEPVKIKMRYKDLTTNKMVETETELPLIWTDSNEELALMAENSDKKLLAIATLNQALKAMSDAFAKGDRGTAKQVLERALADLEGIYPNADDEDVKALREETEGYFDILSNLR